MRMMTPKTVGELRRLLADLPDTMPLHHRGNMGDQPQGLIFMVRTLAEASQEKGYFADIERDEVWSKPQNRETFGEAFQALCSL